MDSQLKAKQMELLEEAACLLKCHGYTEIKQKMKGKKTFLSEYELSDVFSKLHGLANEKKHSRAFCSTFITKLKPRVCHVTSYSG